MVGKNDSTVINQGKLIEANNFLQTHPESNVRFVAEAFSLPQTTTYRIGTEHLLLKLYKMRFVQQLYEEDSVKCCCPY